MLDTKAKTYLNAAKAADVAAKLNAEDADMAYTVEQPEGAKYAVIVVTDRATGERVGTL